MGQYKVPQNVEAEDKIIGPMTLKQFIYAIIGVGWGGLCFLIFKSIPVVGIVVALPFVILFMLLAFYQRDGQNFEQYLVAIVGYFSQSRQRFWRKEDIVDSFKVEPVALKAEQTQRNPIEVRSQLERLATIVDARGWAVHPDSNAVLMPSDQHNLPSESDRLIRPVVTSPNKTLNEPEATDVQDLQRSPLAQNLSALINQASNDVKAEAIEMMRRKPVAAPAASVVAAPQPVTPVAAIVGLAPAATAEVTATPFVIASVVPLSPDATSLIPGTPGEQLIPQLIPSVSVTKQVSSDILRLATESDDLTVSQLAAQATRVGALPEGKSVSLNNGQAT
jgi:hypothetical protein